MTKLRQKTAVEASIPPTFSLKKADLTTLRKALKRMKESKYMEWTA